jgi:hypothetical protein
MERRHFLHSFKNLAEVTLVKETGFDRFEHLQATVRIDIFRPSPDKVA